MDSMKEKVLVTGGAGFIGSNLCDALFARGYQVVCLDNFSTGKRENIQHLLSEERFQLLELDIRDYSSCLSSCQGVDYVLHQAALGSVPRSIIDPITSNDVNVSGFLNMLMAAKESGVKRFVYAGSSSTYGDSEALPKVENNVGNPLSPYAVTKMVVEHYARVFHLTYGLQTIGLRYFNVYGRRQDPNGAYAAVIPKFVQLLMNYQSPVINGDGNYSRDFTYIDNVIQANLLAMTTDNEKALNQVFNVACGQRTTLNDLLFFLKKYLSEKDPKISQVEAVYGGLRKGDIPHSLASIEKGKDLLGFKPSHYFEEGLKEAVDWYWENLH
jgi:UDP-N-acetylglucosamine 4-epimerase